MANSQADRSLTEYPRGGVSCTLISRIQSDGRGDSGDVRIVDSEFMRTQAEMSEVSGRCLCGAVSFRASAAEEKFAACHCRMCQQWAGGPFMATSASNVMFEGEENLCRFSSSAWAERGFCRNCGSNLFYRALQSGTYEMCIGTFDDTSQFELSDEIFIDRKPAGYELAGDHPRLTEAETIARYKELTE